jgi:hypothetical protein
MANIGKWSLSSVGLTTVLTGLTTASGAMSAASSTYDNSSSLDLYVDIEFALVFAAGVASGGYVSLYVYESVDGTNFPAQSAADLRLTSTQLICVAPMGTASATQRVVVRNVLISPAKQQFLLDNQTSQALSSGTVKILPYDYNLNG